jgi:hypothetical protein
LGRAGTAAERPEGANVFTPLALKKRPLSLIMLALEALG